MDRPNANGHIRVLKFWMASGSVEYTERATDGASANGSALFSNDGKHTQEAMDTARSNGYLSVLEWCKARGCRLEYIAKAVNAAGANCRLWILEWWKAGDLLLKYSEEAIGRSKRQGLPGNSRMEEDGLFSNIRRWHCTSESEPGGP
ncbi:hypothetical protein DFJ77DRAFT_436995 [Powellomyces hirtus]|nr:hypothetical protein DFJ77DRAFT_436995 [Powellomyces hirtus]